MQPEGSTEFRPRQSRSSQRPDQHRHNTGDHQPDLKQPGEHPTGDLGEDYDAEAVFPEAGSTTGHVIDLVPKAGGEPVPFRKLRITVDPDRNLVTSIEIHDLFGNVNRLDFSAIELLETVDEKLFSFEIPEGTHVVHPPRG